MCVCVCVQKGTDPYNLSLVPKFEKNIDGLTEGKMYVTCCKGKK